MAIGIILFLPTIEYVMLFMRIALVRLRRTRTPPIPCAALKRHPCRFRAVSFCEAKTHGCITAGIHAGSVEPGNLPQLTDFFLYFLFMCGKVCF
jgi:hypothetical protein